jgi:hypothetical protein
MLNAKTPGDKGAKLIVPTTYCDSGGVRANTVEHEDEDEDEHEGKTSHAVV